MASHSSASSRQMQGLQEQLGSLSFGAASPAAYSTMGSAPLGQMEDIQQQLGSLDMQETTSSTGTQFENFRARRGGRKPKPRDYRASPYPSVLTRRTRARGAVDRRRPVAAKRRNDLPQRTNPPKNRNDVVLPTCVRCGENPRLDGSYRCRKCVDIPGDTEEDDMEDDMEEEDTEEEDTEEQDEEVFLELSKLLHLRKGHNWL
ncbi:hypothetical protein QBC32DRAFT_329177 [Pseudoneurospora amorphoporcata]|uniref:Uncharacterized protein n=1 Tax=Pseudoneurospora amorphoporcata TaxID=241081 RepID=A0AAN6SB71_9PEZI|nr:hypothetical protein QBC32DRAFT_329177 [Pseudoneurospora amorphoporcata]